MSDGNYLFLVNFKALIMAILCTYSSLLRGWKHVIFGVWFVESALTGSLGRKHCLLLGACGMTKVVGEGRGGPGILTDPA